MGAHLIGAQGCAEELVHRVQVHRQGVDLTLVGRFHAVLVGLEGGVALDIVPDLVVAGVEDMRPVGMHHHAGVRVARGVAVARDVGAAVHDRGGQAGLGERARHDGARKARAHHQETVCHARALVFAPVRL